MSIQRRTCGAHKATIAFETHRPSSSRKSPRASSPSRPPPPRASVVAAERRRLPYAYPEPPTLGGASAARQKGLPVHSTMTCTANLSTQTHMTIAVELTTLKNIAWLPARQASLSLMLAGSSPNLKHGVRQALLSDSPRRGGVGPPTRLVCAASAFPTYTLHFLHVREAAICMAIG